MYPRNITVTKGARRNRFFTDSICGGYGGFGGGGIDEMGGLIAVGHVNILLTAYAKECNLPIANVTLKLYLVLSDAKHRRPFRY